MLTAAPQLLAGLYPPFAQAVGVLQQYAAHYGLRGVIPSTGGFRSPAEQERLFAIGRTRLEIAQRTKKFGRGGSVTDAPPGSSAHNWGLAIDVEGPDQAAIIALGKKLGFGTVSWDPAHLEWPKWQQMLRSYGIQV